jgi:hypothetical protein
MRTQGLGERVVLGTDIRTHLGAGGWHGPDEQNSFEDNVVSTAERLFSCAEATARMKKLSASRNVRHTSTKLFAVWKTSREFLWSVTIQHLAPGLCQVAKLSMQREECNSKGEKHLTPSRALTSCLNCSRPLVICVTLERIFVSSVGFRGLLVRIASAYHSSTTAQSGEMLWAGGTQTGPLFAPQYLRHLYS